MIMDTTHEQIRTEASAVGISVGMISGSIIEVISGPKKLGDLIMRAHGKDRDSQEMTDLKDYLKADTRWDAYLALKNEREDTDAKTYFLETSLFQLMDLLEEAVTSDTGSGLLLAVPKEKWLAWKTARSDIRAKVKK